MNNILLRKSRKLSEMWVVHVIVSQDTKLLSDLSAYDGMLVGYYITLRVLSRCHQINKDCNDTKYY